MSAPVLTPVMAKAFALVAEAPSSTYRVPPGPDAAAVEAALWDCERAGLVMHAGRGWRLTPNGAARWADAVAAQTGRRA